MSLPSISPEQAKNSFELIRQFGLYFVSTAALIGFFMWQYTVQSARIDSLQDRITSELTKVVNQNTEAFTRNTEAFNELKDEIRSRKLGQ